MKPRTHADRCPGVLRPWIADDGAIVRLRLIGGVLPAPRLTRLLQIAGDHADGTVLLTKRTNLQLRGIDHVDGCVSPELVDAITEAGFLPSPSHELVRNVMVSPMTGRMGGQADLRATALELDRQLCAAPELARLAGRFLFVLDDGRGDVGGRSLDLGLVAVDAASAQLRIGSHRWGPVVSLDEAPEALIDLAHRFVRAAGDGESAVWHVDELPGGGELLAGTGTGTGTGEQARDVRTQVTSLPLRYGIIAQDDGAVAEHIAVPDGLITRSIAETISHHAADEIVVTPWRSIVLPDLETP